ncbi:MAG: hypothetical protein J7F05_14005 [Trichodesmium erythraeum GBRTRLIN201]|nr:hypothetical protein [Trichodesmium erythraeum GBRTRLIN201]
MQFDKKVFSKLDNLLGQRLALWVSRKHSNKTDTPVWKKHFPNVK